jgi:N-acetyl-anhydromuramoyl-L-alanine amidase
MWQMTNIEHTAAWNRGWYRFAHHQPSPNFGPRPNGVTADLLLLHSISLPPGVFGGPDIVNLFLNRLDWHAHPYFKSIEGLQVSAHFLVGRDGRLWQFVSCDDRAWHAGVSSWHGRSNCNDYSIGIELEGIEGGLFEPCQYETLISLCHRLTERYPIRQVAGHEHVAPGRKTDPGPGFDWPLLRRASAWPDQCFPEGAQTLHLSV